MMQMTQAPLNVLLLAGGVGGAKAAEGLVSAFPQHNIRILGNIADDQEFHGLWVSPDIDTLIYSLANAINRDQGWGLKGDSHRVLERLNQLGAETWMTLGDLDMATHIYRTQARRQGQSASNITKTIAKSFGVTTPILLPTDDVVQTQIKTPQGWLPFQEYFVKQACQPRVLDVRFQGIESAAATPEALAAIAQSDVIIFAPSNPIVSISPILSVPGIRQAIEESQAKKLAISPFIGGKTVKGPADKMMAVAGGEDGLIGVAQLYQGLIDYLIIDHQDSALAEPVKALGYHVCQAQTYMKSLEDKAALMTQALAFLQQTESEQRVETE